MDDPNTALELLVSSAVVDSDTDEANAALELMTSRAEADSDTDLG